MATGTFTFRYIEADVPPSVTLSEYRRRGAAEHRPSAVKRLRRHMLDLYDMERQPGRR